MDWSQHDSLSKRWTELTHTYVSGINSFVATGLEKGWEAAGPEPEDTRSSELGAEVIGVVRAANESGEWRELRPRFPVAHRPFIPILEEASQGVYAIAWIDDERFVASLGTAWQPDYTMVFGTDGEVEPLHGVVCVGRLGQYFGLVRDDHIEVRDGWSDRDGLRLPLPTGLEGLPEFDELEVEQPERLTVERVVPLADGTGVVLATNEGVFASRPAGVTRLFPERETILETMEAYAEAGDATFDPRFDMTHAAVSPDGRAIACGCQDSQHVLFTPDGECIARFGPLGSSYPHHAAFSADGAFLIANSCHFYNGMTVGVEVEAIRGTELPEYEDDDRLVIIDQGMRVYASDTLGEDFVFGDAHGYIRGRSQDGDDLWRHFIGSTVGGLATSPDGTKIAVGTYAGFLVVLEVEPDAPDPAAIGNAGFRELIRYIAWKDYPLMRW